MGLAPAGRGKNVAALEATDYGALAMRRSASFFASLSFVFGGLIGLLAWPGCNFDNPGDAPAKALLYLPSGLLLSAATDDQPARLLYVVNSNFDLRYNAGSLQAYDLDDLDAELARCEQRDRLGPDCEIDPAQALVDEVLVPSFGTGIAASSNHDRLFVVTRTSESLTVVDTREDASNVLDCKDKDRRCNDDYKRGDDPDQSARRLTLPSEAVGVIAGRAQDLLRPGDPPLDGEFVVVAHREGAASLFLEEKNDAKLALTDVLQGLPQEITGLAYDPTSHLAYLSVFDRNSTGLQKRILSRVGIAASGNETSAGGNVFPAAYLYNSGAVSLEGIINNPDTRAIAMNPIVPGQALVVGRDPASLLWVDIASALDGLGPPTQAFVRNSVSLGNGPSRVTVGKLGDRTVAIVSCFDARQIYVLDAATAEILSIVHNFSGPFEIALDSLRQRLYVADFRSSVVRILDLKQIVEGADENMPTARIVATLGRPKLVQELQ